MPGATEMAKRDGAGGDDDFGEAAIAGEVAAAGDFDGGQGGSTAAAMDSLAIVRSRGCGVPSSPCGRRSPEARMRGPRPSPSMVRQRRDPSSALPPPSPARGEGDRELVPSQQLPDALEQPIRGSTGRCPSSPSRTARGPTWSAGGRRACRSPPAGWSRRRRRPARPAVTWLGERIEAARISVVKA